MLEIAAKDASHANVLAHARHSRTQAAQAAHEQINLHASLAGTIQRVDHLRISDRVHLGGDATLTAERHLMLDEIDQLIAHVAWSDNQRLKLNRSAVTGEVIEQLRHIGADRRIAGEKANVLVKTRCLGVVVAGADVAVPAQSVIVLANHQRGLRVRLQTDQPVDHVHARALQRFRPAHVGGFVEARLQLHQHCHLHAALGGAHQVACNRAVAAGAVERHLDALHPRVVGRLGDEVLDAAGKALVRVMNHQCTLANDREDAAVLSFSTQNAARGDRRPRRVLQGWHVQCVQLEHAGEVKRVAVQGDVGHFQVELAYQ